MLRYSDKKNISNGNVDWISEYRRIFFKLGFVLALVTLCFNARAQCNWKTVLFDGFEYSQSITSPDFLPNICYGVPHPASYTSHTGSQAVYINFIDSTNTSPPGIHGGTLFYSKTITVCKNMPYRISSWFCTTFAGVQCNLKIILKDGSGAVINSINNFPCAYAPIFSQYTSGIFTPTVSTITLELYTNVGGTGGNDLGMDDLLIERCVPGITTQTTVCTPSVPFNLYGLISAPTPTYGTWAGASVLTNGYQGTFNPSVSSQGAYAYSYLFQNDSACPVIKDTVKVFLTPTPTLTINSASICIGQQTATLSASGATSYTWSPGTGLSSVTGGTVAATPTVNTTYTVIGKNGGCSDTIISQVTVNPLPILAVSSATICAGASAILSASGASTYTWSPPAGLNMSSGSTVIATPTVITYYTLIGSTAQSCSSTVTSSVNVEPVPLLNVTSGNICLGQSSTLTVSGATNYVWSPSTHLNTNTGNTVVSTPPSTITYTVTGTLGICTNTAVTTVSVNPVPVLSSNSATICYGGFATLAVSGASTYVWSPSNSINSSTNATVVATPSVTTNYIVTGTTGICSSSLMVSVFVSPLPQIVLQASMLITNTPGEEITLTAGGGDAYNWSDGHNSAIITVAPSVTTRYCVTVASNVTGCANDSCITIEVSPESTLYIPNTFTPNGDNVNDTFLIPGTNILEFHIWIYNRWGNLIFESTDMQSGWDGKENGIPNSNGIYAYLVRAKGIDDRQYKKSGHITLIK